MSYENVVTHTRKNRSKKKKMRRLMRNLETQTWRTRNLFDHISINFYSVAEAEAGPLDVESAADRRLRLAKELIEKAEAHGMLFTSFAKHHQSVILKKRKKSAPQLSLID